MKIKVAVGISGGVDSSVAAFLLKKQGYEVVGLWMDIMGVPGNSADAEKVAKFLKIPIYKIDLKTEYTESVISYIREEYTSGRTPNPCVMCNRRIKFGAFLSKAGEAGVSFDYFATGHYAILERDSHTGRFLLRKGLSEDKDQVYFLSMLKQNQLSKLLFPLGGMKKSDVRAIAEEAGLFTALKRESQDLCTGDYRNFISGVKGKGVFTDKNGKVLGYHKGIEHYTIGQRRGLGISSSTQPYYVIEIDTVNNIVILGFDKDLESKEMIVNETNWIAFDEPELPMEVLCKIRYRDHGAPAVIRQKNEDGSFSVIFNRNRRAITPGQVAAFYSNDIVIGAGIIKSSI